jgi:hypothetical protein
MCIVRVVERFPLVFDGLAPGACVECVPAVVLGTVFPGPA